MHKAANNLSDRVGLFLLAFLLVGFAGSASAQIPDPQTLAGRDSKEGVFVRDSALAVEKLALAQRMEHLREWDKAAEVYQEILKNFADRLVPSQLNSDNLIFQYSSVTPLVQERLAKWPQEALTIYRARYEGDAAALLESAKDDPSQLLKVVNLYFVTDSAKRSALHLMDLYFERGEFAATSWLGQRMLKFHPMLGDDKARFLFRAAIADHVGGNNEQAQTSLKDLTAQFPAFQGDVRGTIANLSEILKQELSSESARPAESWPDSWPTAFGNAERSRVNQISVYGGAKLMSVGLDKLNMRAVPASQQEAMRNQNAADMGNGLMTGIFPVVDNGELFFQDNANVYAVSLESDTPLPGWAATYSGEHAGHYSISTAWPTPRSQQCTLTVTSDSVFAVMGLPDVIIPSFTGTFGLRETRLVCLDRRTGAEKWVAMPKKFPEANASLRELDLTGSPLVVGDSVFVQARGGKGMQFEDSYVLAFEVATGKLKWACYVASANTGKQYWEPGLGTLLGQNNSHLAYSNGRIFTLTNLGAVASVDAYDGQIIWLDIYEREIVRPQRQFGWRGGWRGQNQQRRVEAMTSVRPWVFNPAVVSNGRVFVLPSDSSDVHIYDAGSGSEIKRISMDAFDSSQVLLGVVDDRLIVHSESRVYCINWPAYEPGRTKQSILWESSSLQVGNPFDNVIKGRGLVTSDSVLIPTTRKLFRLALNGGKIVQMYPSGDGASWPDDEGPGNVLAAGDRVIVAGPTAGNVMRVNVYADLAMASARMEAAITAAPEDAALRLRFADILFAAGKYPEAAARLDEAIGLIGKSPGNNASQRIRAFETAMSYGQKLSKDFHAPILDLAGAMFDRAGASASTPLQKVRYRLAKTALAKPRNQVAAEVKLYQQILADPELRSVPITDADGTTMAAGEKARVGIDDAILRGGIAVYASYEQEAGNAVLAAAKVKDPEKLQAISLAYPNSVASARALLLAADIYESLDNPRKATQVLRQTYFRYPNAPDHERVIEALARNYLRLPNRIDVAIARLLQGAAANASAKLTRPLILQDGTKIEGSSFSEAAQSLRKYRAVVTSRNLPDIGIPLIQGSPKQKEQLAAFKPENAAQIIAGVEMLVTPPVDLSRNDRIVAYSSREGVRVFAVGQVKPLVTCDTIKQMPMGCAWSGQNVLVWSNSEMALISPDTGQTLWTWTIRSAAALEVLANGDQPDQDQATPAPRQDGQVQVFGRGRYQLQGGGQIIVQGNGILRIGGGGVQILPAVEPTPKPSEEQVAQVVLVNDRAIVGTTDGRIIALDLDGGKLIWQASLGDHAPNQLLANDDFVVGRLNEDNNINSQVVVFDTATGQVLTRRSFGTDGDSASLVNLALSPDGMALLLTSDRLIGKDLFEPGGLEKPTYQFGTQPGMGANFTLSTSSDHLQIAGDRVILVVTNNAGSTVRVLSLRDGTPLRIGGDEAMLQLDGSSAAMRARFAVRCIDSTLYTVTQHEMRRMDLESGVKSPQSLLPITSTWNVRDVFVTKSYLVTMIELAGPGFRGNQITSPLVRLLAFSRAPDPKGIESGRLDYTELLSSGNAQLTAWQLVDGGLYFLTKDEKLHFLPGAAN